MTFDYKPVGQTCFLKQFQAYCKNNYVMLQPQLLFKFSEAPKDSLQYIEQGGKGLII